MTDIDNERLVSALIRGLETRTSLIGHDGLTPSLAYLERLPVTRLKIDRSFVSTGCEPQNARIMEMITSLARQLGMKVVAEGIEDAGQLDHVRRLGCSEVQGFWLARPCPFDELMAWMQSRR